MKRYTKNDFDTQFPTDDACLEFVKNARWPDGIPCKTCGKITKHHRITGRSCYSCDWCGTQVYPLAGTIFHKSPTSLRSWFHAIFLMASTRCGISAKQVEREIGVTYKTAWRIFKHVRMLMDEKSRKLSGYVEADETYIGGRRPGKRGRGAAGKTIAMGLAKRQGRIVVKVVPDVKGKTLMANVTKHVTAKSTVITDDMSSYGGLRRAGFQHLKVRHSAKVYVDGIAHTNTVDGFWSLVKRGIDGTHHAVSPKYLQAYLNEYAFRYNHRNDEGPMFTTLVDRVSLQAARPS